MVKHSTHSKNFTARLNLTFFLFILLSLTSAEEVTLLSSQEIEFKTIPIELISVGSYGSISLKVNGLNVMVSKGEQITFQGINITLIETTSNTAKIDLTQAVECLSDLDCNDNFKCTEDTCTVYNDCISTPINGCIKGDSCMQEGTIETINNTPSYCDSNLEWKKRKVFNEACTNNHECLSGICKDSLCTKEETKMAPSWILIIIGVILLLKGVLFFYHPEKTKNILREMSYMKPTSMKILGIFIIILGIILLVWTLT